ncbi:MAG: GxxExxY protein [Candidatus Omnitrophica bacterium]|nr:GxxExxY protein [Candidatus Omnitrophota bacterium]
MNTDKKVDVESLYKYQDLTSDILNCAFEVHNSLGCGFLERVYEKTLIRELELRGLKLTTQKVIKIKYKDKDVGIYLADLIVENKVIVELKVVEFLSKIHKAQAINYLKASGYRVALILNFSKPRLEYKRAIV